MLLKKHSGFIAAVLAGTLLLSGCGGINKDATLVTIKDGDATSTISLGYGNFAARYTQALYDVYYGSYMGEDMWTQDMSGSGVTMQEETKDTVVDDLEEWYLAAAHADEYNVSLSDEDKASIDEAAAAFMSSNSEEAIEQIGATEEYVKQLLTDRTIASRVRAAIETEAEGKIEITDDEVRSATFSYYKFDKAAESPASATADAVTKAIEDIESGEDPNDNSETEAANQEALSNAKKVASGDFEKDGEKLDATLETYSYVIAGDSTDETLDPQVIDAAKKLKEGQVSDVIETDSGYYVIRLDSEHDDSATETKRSSVKTEKISEYYDDILEGWKKSITWTLDEKVWKKVGFEERFTNGAPAAEQETTDGTDVTEQVAAGEEVTAEDAATE